MSTPGNEGFQRTFVVDVAPDAVWEALTGPQPRHTGDDTVCFLHGFEARCSVLERDPGRFLRLRKDEDPCSGTEIAVRLEHAGSGTRVTVVQSGFGPWLADVIETFAGVWHMIVADLKLYLERGITIKTHLFDQPPPGAGLGCTTVDQLEGLRVTAVETAGCAAGAGVRADDLLLRLNGVRLLTGLQLLDLMRMCQPGQELEVVWARGAELMQGRGVL